MTGPILVEWKAVPRPCQNLALHQNPTGLCDGCAAVGVSPKNINRTHFVATGCVVHCLRTGVKTGRGVIGSSVDVDCGKKKLSRFQLQGRFRLPAAVRTQRLHCSARFVANPSCWRFFGANGSGASLRNHSDWMSVTLPFGFISTSVWIRLREVVEGFERKMCRVPWACWMLRRRCDLNRKTLHSDVLLIWETHLAAADLLATNPLSFTAISVLDYLDILFP